MEPFPIFDLKIGKTLHVGDTFSKDSVIDFLKTPVLIRRFTVTTLQTPGTTLQSIVLPFDSNNDGHGTDVGQGMMMKRLNAYLGFRGTAVVRFQINCNRFAQGRLLIHYIPGQFNSIYDTQAHRYNLMTKSQNPRTEINLNRDTNTVFRVPYVSANGAYDLSGAVVNERTGIMGTLYATVYGQLKGTASLQVNTFLCFEDVELMTPTYWPQMNVSDREEMKGILSAPIQKLADAAGLMARIPSLSSIAGTAKWFLEASSKSAKAFGFSKPTNQTELMRTTNTKNAYMLNYDGEEDNIPMGMSSRNKVDVLPGFAGNDIDEMSFEYVCNRPAYQTTFNWVDTDTTFLYSLDLKPPAFETTSSGIGIHEVKTLSPFAFVARHFNYWRADIVVTLKIVKTEFHTGKLMVSFRPGAQSASDGYTDYNMMNYAPREILDIKESDTFMITFPYCLLTPYTPWKQSIGVMQVAILNPLNAPDSVSSFVDIIVETSAKNVQFSCLSEYTMIPATGDAPEFTPQGDVDDEGFSGSRQDELSNVSDWGAEADDEDEDEAIASELYVITHATNVQLVQELLFELSTIEQELEQIDCETPYRAQSGLNFGDLGEIAPREKALVVGSLKENSYDANLPRYCVGEEITSFKQLMQRKCVLNTNSAPGAAANRGVRWRPFTVAGAFYFGGTDIWSIHPLAGGYYSMASCCYCLSRGGVRYQVFVNGTTTSGFFGCISNASFADVADYDYEILSTTTRVKKNSMVPHGWDSQGKYFTLEVPQLSNTHSREVETHFNWETTKIVPLGVPNQYVYFNMTSNINMQTGMMLQQSVADDFQLGFFIGVPTMIILEGWYTYT
jgi:hypothetical protein